MDKTIKPSFLCMNIFTSVQFSCSVVSLVHDPMDQSTPGLPFTSPTPGVCSNSCPWSRWCHPTISSSVIPFSFRLQSFPASGSFPMSQLLTSGDQSIAASASATVFPMNTQSWFSLGLTGLISLLSKRFSRVLSSTTFGSQPSLWSDSHIGTWLLENHSLNYTDLSQQSDVSAF